jgi:hypothetical protein
VSGRGVVAVATALAFLAACTPGRYDALEAGQCLPDDAGVEGVRAQDPDVVPCSRPHRYEVVSVFDLEPPEPGWPGADVVDLNARQLCAAEVLDVLDVGVDELHRGVRMVSVAPTESSWRDQGDRQVECLLRWPEVTTSTLVPR